MFSNGDCFVQVDSLQGTGASFLQRVLDRGPGKVGVGELGEGLQSLRSLEKELRDLFSQREQLNLAARLLELEIPSFPALQQVRISFSASTMFYP
jgi:hypothetical protein